MTIEQYHRIADEGGPLHVFYHMSLSEFVNYLDMVEERNTTRDSLREDSPQFKRLEDDFGKLDEFAAGIRTNLYHKKTFMILASNYCSKRVVPRLNLLMKPYGVENYSNPV